MLKMKVVGYTIDGNMHYTRQKIAFQEEELGIFQHIMYTTGPIWDTTQKYYGWEDGICCLLVHANLKLRGTITGRRSYNDT